MIPTAVWSTQRKPDVLMSQKAAPVRPKGDGVVRIQRQTSGRKGKGVCLITGVDLDDAELTKLAAELKKNAAAAEQLKMELLKSRAISVIY